jgi:hypothetical protein
VPVLVFIRLGSRPIEHVAVTRHPDEPWAIQQTRNLHLDEAVAKGDQTHEPALKEMKGSVPAHARSMLRRC